MRYKGSRAVLLKQDQNVLDFIATRHVIDRNTVWDSRISAIVIHCTERIFSNDLSFFPFKYTRILRMWKNCVPAIGVRRCCFYNINETLFALTQIRIYNMNSDKNEGTKTRLFITFLPSFYSLQCFPSWLHLF
jgi:hypothetical protein